VTRAAKNHYHQYAATRKQLDRLEPIIDGTSIWTTQDGERIRICEMSDRHLTNTINVLTGDSPIRTVFHTTLERKGDWLSVMLHERQNRRRTKMLSQLKNFVVERLDLEEMFYLSALGKLVRAEYVERALTVPEWLTDQLATLDREINARRRDELEREMKQIRAEEAGLETAQDKRERLARRKAEIEKQLGVGQTVQTPA
jgi:hypothetical protein